MSANALYTALLSAQADFNPVVKNKQNPHLKNYYADLGAVLDAVIDPLATHGLLIVQRFASEQAAPVLITELIHAESGQSISSTLPIVSKDPSDPQKLGGAITYARRYSLLALLGLSPEDDDGNAAAQPRQQGTTRQPANPPQTTQQRPAQRAEQVSPPAPAAYTMTDFWRETKQAGYGDPVALADYLRIATFKGYEPLDLLTMFRDQQKKETAQ